MEESEEGLGSRSGFRWSGPMSGGTLRRFAILFLEHRSCLAPLSRTCHLSGTVFSVFRDGPRTKVPEGDRNHVVEQCTRQRRTLSDLHP